MFQAAQGPDGLIWTDKERAVLQPSLPIMKVKWESMSLFWRLEGEIGLQEAFECFQKALDSGREEMEHDVMGC